MPECSPDRLAAFSKFRIRPVLFSIWSIHTGSVCKTWFFNLGDQKLSLIFTCEKSTGVIFLVDILLLECEFCRHPVHVTLIITAIVARNIFLSLIVNRYYGWGYFPVSKIIIFRLKTEKTTKRVVNNTVNDPF